MKEIGILSISRDDDIGQYVIPTNIPGPQEPKRDIASVLTNNGLGSDMHTIKEDN